METKFKGLMAVMGFTCLWQPNATMDMVSFTTDSEELCYGELVEYQCIVEYDEVEHQCNIGDSLQYKLLNSTDTSVATQSYSITDLVNTNYKLFKGCSLFSSNFLNGSSNFLNGSCNAKHMIANISFVANSSTDGYTIQCNFYSDNEHRNDSRNITISVASPPLCPTLNISHGNKKITVKWTPPSKCIANYTVVTNATNSTITTTNTSVTILLDGLSAGVYCVSVAAVDTANRTGEYSEEECFNVTSNPVSSPSSSSDYSTSTIYSTQSSSPKANPTPTPVKNDNTSLIISISTVISILTLLLIVLVAISVYIKCRMSRIAKEKLIYVARPRIEVGKNEVEMNITRSIDTTSSAEDIGIQLQVC